MIDQLPDPLTPADSDLRSLDYMPLKVAQLRKSRSWLIAKRNPEVGFYMMNLWAAAWHNVPAGSLEDDDDVLADMAMCQSYDRWVELKEVALRGWVKCSDGRLYHRVVAERVNEALTVRQSYRQRLARARAAKEQRSSDTPDAGLSHANGSPVADLPHSYDSAVVDLPQACDSSITGLSQDESTCDSSIIGLS